MVRVFLLQADFGREFSFETCGTRKEKFRRRRDSGRTAIDFVYRGVEAGLKQHPWHAGLNLDNVLDCGGTLISRTAVLTGEKSGFVKEENLRLAFAAAHCIFYGDSNEMYDVEEIEVVLGMYELFDQKERSDPKIRQKLKVINFI